jgi:hypothetical protein
MEKNGLLPFVWRFGEFEYATGYYLLLSQVSGQWVTFSVKALLDVIYHVRLRRAALH